MSFRLVLNSLKNARNISLIGRNEFKKQVNKPLSSVFSVAGKIQSRSFSASVVSLQQESENVLKNLSTFLTQEIQQENELRSSKTLPKMTGFDVKTDGPNVTLTKTFQNEKIEVKFNINGSLDNTEPNMDVPEDSGKEPEPTQMKSRPPFTVDIARGGKTLSFGCSFLPAEEGEKDAPEDFQIDEFSIHSGEWNDNVYTADCSVLDGQLYDILLNLLDERGLGEQFANEMAEFSTSFEHSQYISLLEKLKEFSK